MTLLDAREFDPAKERKRKTRIVLIILIALVVLSLAWWFRFWREERVVSHFFEALQKQDYNAAYGIWMNDPQWQKHPGQFTKYPYGDFYRDWGPGSEWGLIKTERVYGASTCPGPGGTGVVVDVIVNDRTQHAQVWVEKADHTLSYPPCELIFR
jgi:hypothetical protein